MIAIALAPQLSVRLASTQLDARLAAGEDPLGSPALALRGAQLVSRRLRTQVAAGLEAALGGRPEPGALSAAIPVDGEAVALARPDLAELARELRARERVDVRGVALARALLTDPASALYRAQSGNELGERVREAIAAL